MRQEKVISSQQTFKGRLITVRVDTVELPSGKRSTREVVEHGNSVAIVPLDDKGQALLVRQFREAIGKTLLEVPAGGLKPGETPEECVIRELQEETGFKPRKLEKLGGFYASPGFCTEFLHLFLATDLEPSQLYDEDTESIEVVKAPLSKIPQLIADGSIEDSKSIAGLLVAITRSRSGNS